MDGALQRNFRRTALASITMIVGQDGRTAAQTGHAPIFVPPTDLSDGWLQSL